MNARRRLISVAALTGVTALTLAATSACSSSGATAGDTGTFDVVASFYPMAFLAEQIGGKHVHVTSLTQPGQEPHDLEISAKQTAQLQESDAVLYLKNLQPSVDEAVAQSEVKTKIDAASLTTLEEHGNEVGGHAAAHDTQKGEEDSGGKDPHIWLDPVRYAEVAKGVGKAFEKADPKHADTYKANTDVVVKKLDALDSQFAEGLKNTKSKVFITTHAAFGYLAERYGLTEEAVNGLDPESEPSAARVRDLETTAKADGVTTVFYETLVSDRTAKTIAKDANLVTDVLDPIEGITSKSRGKDYFSVQEANLKALQTALGTK
ncbi:metal ABC transporter substrate-binding protein [Streptomyces chiangmaiensis]|uniref:Metal ABC transporter substrate-binding protein n=1 Tax=Streptomyces chiangmaiensis TaxID=766497 RepID=A0ABU7FKC9_9ACTN|nr:metal ABC transporter substrate-binding protein [Streptomyces chiangmaiensis]MED7824404.1 metal ABC transporter substrate-binding protein [Streptomyces chiangmaiensis]